MDQFYELAVWRAASAFPEALDLVLPTRLGNVMRAYERYSDVVYEIEAIVLWPRLFMIIPEEVRDRIRESEGLLHFSINMLLTSIITLLTCGVMISSIFYDEGLSGLAKTISWPVILIVVSGLFSLPSVGGGSPMPHSKGASRSRVLLI